MSYFKALGLSEEPFSTSPDPGFFYESSGHKEALLRLEISIRLRRGMSVILGDVGTGKTTLARKLFAALSDKTKYDVAMILDPCAHSETEFLSMVADAYDIHPETQTELGYKKALETYLFHRGVDEGRTVVLIIDEAQKLDLSTLESLRTLLNYETNKYKLFQLVLLGQMEILPIISRVRNFWERIALKYVINPLNNYEIREMITFRLRQAGYLHNSPLFQDEAIDLIYNYTQGCPRRICHLCHDSLEMLVMRGQQSVDRDIVNERIAEDLEVMIGSPV